MPGSIAASIVRALALTASAALLWCAAAAAQPSFASADGCGKREVRRGDRCENTRTVRSHVLVLARQEMDESDLKAVILKAKVGDRNVVFRALGHSMTGVPATRDMHFRTGAVSIAYIGTLLLQLDEEGKLSVDDTLSEYFPAYPNADRITLRMLANTTSGYADYVAEGLPIEDDVFRAWRPQELIDFGLSRPAACEPGTCWHYSHTNFVILSEVISQATGKPVRKLMRRRILRPLGLRDTHSSRTAAIPNPVLHAFSSERGVYEDSTFWNPSWSLGRGEVMTSNVKDLERSAVAIGKGELLSRRAHREQLAPLTANLPPLSPDAYYGIGVVVRNGWVFQNPSFNGFSAVMAYLPSRRISIAVTSTNGPNSSEDRHTEELFDRITRYLAPGASFSGD